MTKPTVSLLLAVSTVLSSSYCCLAFSPTVLRSSHLLQQQQQQQSSHVSLFAKKKKKNATGKGFGKVEEKKTPPVQPAATSPTPTNQNAPLQSSSSAAAGLASVDNGSTAIPTIENPSTKPLNIDPNLSPDDRAKTILRSKYGLKSYEETQSDYNEAKAEAIAKAKERSNRLKAMAEGNVPENFDVFALIPPPLLKFIDSFLKIGLGVTTVGFVAAGIGITAEAWATATGNTLPENVDTFIVNVVEPNFTPALFVLLGFSISLGVFAAAQLGSSSSVYQEKP